MGAAVSNYGKMLLGLLVALIVLAFVLKVGKKAPLVGPLASKAEELATL